MSEFTSGFVLKEDGSYIFLVNTKFYRLKDDITCFELSRSFHHMQNMIIKDDYKIMRANIKNKHGNGWDFWIDFDDNGKEEFRVYEVIESNE